MVTLEDCYIVIPIFASPTRHSRHGENSLSVLYVKPPNEPSEIRTFKAFEGVSIEPRKEAIAEYLSFSFIPGTNTFLESIY